MFNCTDFSYDGRSSDEFGLKIINSGTGLNDSIFGKKRSVISDSIPLNPLPYYFGTKSEPLTFHLELFSKSPWTERKRREVARWLFQNTYKPFISADNPDLIYYAVCADDSRISLEMGKYGTISLGFICNAPWPWSRQMIVDCDCRYNTNNSNPYAFDVNNISTDNDWPPVFEIEIYVPKLEDYPNGDAPSISENALKYSIRNTRNTRPDSPFSENSFIIASEKFPKAPLMRGETLCVNMYTEQIFSDQYKYRLRNCNEKWLRLEYGINTIEITGTCVLRARGSYPQLR